MYTATKLRDRLAALVAVACAVAICGLAPTPSRAQGMAIAVSVADMSALTAQCSNAGGPCLTALQALVKKLVAAHPGVPVSTILTSVVAEIPSLYNSGAISAAVTSNLLSAAANEAQSQGLTNLSAAISEAMTSVKNGDPIDQEAVAQGSASPT